MDFVGLLRFRTGTSDADRDAAMARRAAWKYPAGVRVVAEYWPTTAAYQAVTIFTTDDVADLMTLEFEWNDVFDVEILPAVSAEDGLRLGPEVMAGLARASQAGQSAA